MPIINLITPDMFIVEHVCDYMVDLVNLEGRKGLGVALEFRRRSPDHIEAYRTACRTGELRIGTIFTIEETSQSWGIMNFPTKRSPYDMSSTEDICRGLEALRDMCNTDRYRHAVICMPIPGSGLGGRTYDEIYPLMVDHLSDLETMIFISLSPDKTDIKPRYLSILGHTDYGHTDEDKQNIDKIIDLCMVKWGMKLSDYTGILSSGEPGVDQYIAGHKYLHKPEETYVFKHTGKPGFVIRPNEHRNAAMALSKCGEAICEAGHDIIMFKPRGLNNNRLTSLQIKIENRNKVLFEHGREPKRVAIFGDRSTHLFDDNLLIPV